MKEIDVSVILNEDCGLLSASRAELGDNAGAITWDNCLALADAYPVVNDSNRDDIRDHFAEYGAWERNEIEAWSDRELSALVLQEAAADYREFEDYCNADWDEYQSKAEQGAVSGRLYLATDGKLYLSIGG